MIESWQPRHIQRSDVQLVKIQTNFRMYLAETSSLEWTTLQSRKRKTTTRKTRWLKVNSNEIRYIKIQIYLQIIRNQAKSDVMDNNDGEKRKYMQVIQEKLV